MLAALDKWWVEAKSDFSAIANSGETISEVRAKLLTSIKAGLITHKVIDEFQVAGVFVNWWTNIKYDLKTIATIGWVPSLVPKNYFIEKKLIKSYFKNRKSENLSRKKFSLKRIGIGIPCSLINAETFPFSFENRITHIMKSPKLSE